MRQTFPTITSGRIISRRSIPNNIQSVRWEVNQITEEISERCKWLNRMGKRLSRFGLRPVCPHHHGKRGLKRFFCSECWRRWRWEFSWRIRLGERRWAEFNNEWKELERKFESLRKEIIPSLRSKLSYALWLKLNDLLLKGRKDLEKLRSTLSDPSNSRRSERIDAFKRMAQLGFPIAVTTLSIGNNLPFETCFDTLIVDEASSCDPASLLPLLYRAKRVVIVGDPKQLDHVTQGRWEQVNVVPKLCSVEGEVFEASFGVSAYSLFERLIGGEKRTLWLTDHFRCPPHIIAFANRQFYGGRLRIHTQSHELEPITPERVSGNHRRNADGSATNDEQIRRALQLLVELASKYPKNTIGLVAPYRAFIDDVLDILHTNPAFTILREKLERQELIIGTAHRFQGSEVDYLIFATVIGDNSSGRERGWVENPNLFNVSITRARRKLIVLLSPVFEKHLSLTRRLLKAKPISSDESNVDEQKRFIKEVAIELEKLGVAFRAGSIYHGDPVDLLEDSDEPKWGVLSVSCDDLATWKPLDFLRFLERQLILERGKLILWRILPPEFENLVTELLISEKKVEVIGKPVLLLAPSNKSDR